MSQLIDDDPSKGYRFSLDKEKGLVLFKSMVKHDFQAISMDISYGPTFHREMHMYQVEDLTMEVTFFHFCIHLLCNNYFYNYISSWNFQEC